VKRKIIIFGGTFNPVHNAHLRIARFILNKFKPDKLIFIPCNIPYHRKTRGLVAGEHRLEMLRLAIAAEPRFEVSDMEIKRGGKTFSIQTLKTLRKKYPKNTEFYFLIGSDSLLDLPRWYQINKLLKLCRFITISRPGYPFDKPVGKLPFPTGILGDLKRLYQPKVKMNISSTQIRETLWKNKPLNSLAPRVVIAYINRHKLYA